MFLDTLSYMMCFYISIFILNAFFAFFSFRKDRIFNGTVESRLMSSAAHDCLCQASNEVTFWWTQERNVRLIY